VERSGSILVFVKTKNGADKIVKRLKFDGHKADAIHGNLRQSKRDRVINGFRNGNSRILVATDVAARGLDIPVIKHVINYDLPQVPEDYIHRIGRTGRAGKDGSALTFLTPSDRYMWNSISKLIDPNYKPPQRDRDQKRNFRGGKKSKGFNKKRKFREDKKSNFRERKKSFKKYNNKKFDFKDKNKPSAFTNNPKYFNRKPNEDYNTENSKRSSFKNKKRFKNRKRPKNFSFKKHKRK